MSEMSPPHNADSNQRQKLLNALARLQQMKVSGSIAPRLRIALAEAEFRLATLSETPLSEALERLEHAVAIDPYHPKFFLYLGHRLYLSGDYSAAINRYRQAINLAPTSQRIHAHLALCLLEMSAEEKKVGHALFDAAKSGLPEKMAAVVKELDGLLERRRTGVPDNKPASGAASDKEHPLQPKEQSQQRTDTAPGTWGGLWRLIVVTELVDDSIKTKQIEQILNGDTIAPAEIAVISLLQVMYNQPLKVAEDRLKSPRLQAAADDPAVQMLRQCVDLLNLSSSAEFVTAASAAMADEALPADLVYALHYRKCGVDANVPPSDALTLLNSYPPEFREEAGFRALELAILDSYARRFWAKGQHRHARLLWEEILTIDHFNVAAEHNLALLAARIHDKDSYVSSWTRAAELRYLIAAAARDVQVRIEERKTMHLAVAQQSRSRYIKNLQKPDEQELARWLKDPVAVEAWMQEWNLYYINSRLEFQSPVHTLGIEYDADEAAVDYALKNLSSLIETMLGDRSWSGIKTFCALAQQRLDQCADAARKVVMRARDPYYEAELGRATRLLQELSERALALYSILAFLLQGDGGANLEIGFATAQALFVLPLQSIEKHLKESGGISHEVQLVQVFATHAAAIFSQGDVQALPADKIAARLAALDNMVALVPDIPSIKIARFQLLIAAKRGEQAYTEAAALLDTLPEPNARATHEEVKEYQAIRSALQNVLDNAAISTIPENLLRPTTPEQANAMINEGKRALQRFPKAHGLRRSIADLLEQLNRSGEAAELLRAGAEQVTSSDERRQLQEKADELTAYAEVDELIRLASTVVNSAVERFNLNQTPENMDAIHRALPDAITKLERARELARARKLTDRVQKIEKLLRQFRQMLTDAEESGQQRAASDTISSLLNSTVESINKAQAEFQQAQTAQALKRLEQVVIQGIADAQRARQMAVDAEIDQLVEWADKVIEQLLDISRQVQQAKKR